MRLHVSPEFFPCQSPAVAPPELPEYSSHFVLGKTTVLFFAGRGQVLVSLIKEFRSGLTENAGTVLLESERKAVQLKI